MTYIAPNSSSNQTKIPEGKRQSWYDAAFNIVKGVLKSPSKVLVLLFLALLVLLQTLNRQSV